MKELDFAFIGKRIREIRVSKHLTQEYLAEQTGVNVSHISNIEHNKVKVSLTLLVGICNVLDVSVDYLLANEYNDSSSAIALELCSRIRTLPQEKQEMLLRIAGVI